MDPKPYLEYLDKEMTIMGILSAFAVAAPAGILATAIGKDSHVAEQLWASAKLFLLAGSILSVLASGFFYKERSLLALYFGLISLAQVEADGSQRHRSEVKKWLDKANSFKTWWPYCCGFTLLFAAFAYYLAGIFLFIVPTYSTFVSTHLHPLKVIFFCTIAILAAAICLLETHARVFKDTSFWSECGEYLKLHWPKI